MRRLLLFVALAVFPAAAQAQVTIDMSKITCADLLAMDPGRSRAFGAWMSGWFNHRFGSVSVGTADYARNAENVRQWCTHNRQQSVMAALERSTPQAAPPGGQVKIDMSLLTCQQFVTSDADRQEWIAAWMSGYFHASKNQPVFDFQRFANNKKAVTAHCRKQGRETLMSAIQKRAR